MLTYQNLKSFLDKALSGYPQTLQRSFFRWSDPLEFLCAETEQQTMSLRSDPSWHNFSYAGKVDGLNLPPAPAFRFQNLKDCDITGVKLVLTGTANGWEFLSTNSAGRNLLSCMRVQGGNTGFLWLGPNSDLWKGGADNSVWTLLASEAHGCKTGFQVIGSNSLDYHLINCRATFCDVGLDFTQGGAGSVLDHFGGSSCKTLVKIGGGFECDIRYLTSELCGTVLQIGDAGDAGQEMYRRISFGDNRDCKILADIYGCGETVLEFPQPRALTVNVTNKSQNKTGKLTVLGNPLLNVVVSGKYEVVGSQQVAV